MANQYNDKAANLNTVLISIAGGLCLVVGYFCKSSLETINSKLDDFGNKLAVVQTDITTTKTELPYMQTQIDALKTSVWGHDGNEAAPAATTTARH
jgi:hypothetical protein